LKDLVIVGAGGLGREIAWLTERINAKEPQWNLLGFLDDDPALHGKSVNGYPVIGGCQDIPAKGELFAVCAIGAAAVRQKVTDRLKDIAPTLRFATLIDPCAVVSPRVTVGEGAVICAGAVVTVDISIGKHVLISSACTVGHDTVLSDHVTLYPGANVAGNVLLERGVEVGTGAQIIQGKRVGAHAIIGAGAVVVGDLPDRCTAVGVPARPIKFQH
jgi:sugar O-acyltransferase (sialic acid O-acetyltransferase NeuD family)